MAIDTFVKPSESSGTFSQPEKLPVGVEEARFWQEANKSFWEKSSMRYDWKESIPYQEFTGEFYQEIDKRFLSATYSVMPWKKIPFEQWIGVDTLGQKDVLEIGVGNGTHASILAPMAKYFTGIDLTDYAVKSTKRRLELSGMNGQILQMDAEQLKFPSESFDFVWSWGVIHHSSNTDKIVSEIQRVLRPGGKTVIMVYYRSWWSYYIASVLLGTFKGYLFKGKTLHQINQAKTDGALARYYTLASWKKLIDNRFIVSRLETLGNKGDLLPMRGGKVKSFILNLIPSGLTVFFLRNCRMGSFLICELVKG